MHSQTLCQKNLLVLDVDETLVHASDVQLNRQADFCVGHYHVYTRPYLEQFLIACLEWYEVGIWSSASDPYVFAIVAKILPAADEVQFVWGSSRTKTKRTLPSDYERFGYGLEEYHAQKNLSKLKRLGWPLQRILIVDDSPEKCATNYGNAIYPKPFEGQQDDNELRYLASYLKSIKQRENYRNFEKRTWRSTVEPMDW